MKVFIITLLATSLFGCANMSKLIADNNIFADDECSVEKQAAEPTVKMVEALTAAPSPIVIQPSDKDGDGVYDENDRCPNTEAGKKVDQRGCPEILVTLLGINFSSDSSKVLPNSETILAKAVNSLNESVGISVIIEGHTDNIGSFSYNQLLSEARAKAVRDYLIAHGIASERLVSVGHGQTSPVANNNSKQGRYQNRRVELRTVGTAFIKQEKLQ